MVVLADGHRAATILDATDGRISTLVIVGKDTVDESHRARLGCHALQAFVESVGQAMRCLASAHHKDEYRAGQFLVEFC